MKLELAHSLQIVKDVTAEEADKFFSEGVLTSKHLFECPESNCSAQVTCANLDRPKRLRKREPYFKFVSEHSSGCRLEAETDENIRHVRMTREDPEALPFIFDDVVDLDLSSPKKCTIHDLPASDDEEAVAKRLRRGVTEDGENIKHRNSRKRLSGLVNAFIRKENFFLNTTEGKLPLRNFFIKVDDSKDLSEYMDEPRIFFGKAWLNRKDDYYLVRFDKKIRAGKLRCKPTFFIPARLVDSSEYDRTSRETLDKIALATKPLYLFIFSELPPVKNNEGEYINFKLDDLTYLYYLPWGQKS
ncbi:hypothetical protein [Serratia proteamaculans]|uniref:hypothetical protein n=1 Tax=Serratia proteamaculans TaxID=28151 RepID=UPI0039B00098